MSILNNENSDLKDYGISFMGIYQKKEPDVKLGRHDHGTCFEISYLESGDVVFYAVGLAHLLQENGLVDALRASGYTVEPVVYKN